MFEKNQTSFSSSLLDDCPPDEYGGQNLYVDQIMLQGK